MSHPGTPPPPTPRDLNFFSHIFHLQKFYLLFFFKPSLPSSFSFKSLSILSAFIIGVSFLDVSIDCLVYSNYWAGLLIFNWWMPDSLNLMSLSPELCCSLLERISLCSGRQAG